MNNSIERLQGRRVAEYEELIKQFIQKVKDLDLNGIEEPHLPVVGANYEKCRYKFAFCGMETKGWGPLSEFVKKNPVDLVSYADYTLNDLEYLRWPANFHATFWGFVLRFLSKFYDVPFQELKDGKHPEILSSFVWANANSIERYETSAQGQGASHENWQKVKQSSRSFDNLNHVINFAQPKVVFILSSRTDKEYFLEPLAEFGLKVNDKSNYMDFTNPSPQYGYYYRRDTNTHIFSLPHPTYMGAYSGKSIDDYVESLIKNIQMFNIWEQLPVNGFSWEQSDVPSYPKNSMEYKRDFVAKLAKYLVDNDLRMSGQELQALLTRNKIRTNYGSNYSENGGRGVHRLISNVWEYYHGHGDYQTAYNIARAFVNKNDEYAYNV
ncbi:MAG: hypothetical protein K5651_08440 [Bacteroidales bacterium]|nr:hypothetical protein [Bacteroidales bacterium]